MTDTATAARPGAGTAGPPALDSISHVSLPCRDLEAGKRFWRDVMGARLRVDTPTFASLTLCGVDVGIGTEGCTFIGRGAEYPHVAFFCDADALAAMKAWLGRCGIPTSNYWTRSGVETLMFFRDPSGNVVELFCRSGFPGADRLPKGPPRGHGTAVDIETLYYNTFAVPA